MLSDYNFISIVILFCLVLFLDAVFLRVIIPGRFNKFTSWVLSPVTTVLMVEDVSRKEQNEAEEMKTPEEVKTVEKSLFSLSLFNLTIFTCYTLLITLLIDLDLINADQNNILMRWKLNDSYDEGIFAINISVLLILPLAVVNIFSCLLMYFLPATSSKGCVRSINTVLNILIFSGISLAIIIFIILF